MQEMQQSFVVCVGLVAGLAAALHGAPATETKHLKVATSSAAAAVVPGSRVSLIIDVTPKPTMHVYAPGQKEYIPVSLAIQTDPAFKTSVARFPTPEKVLLEALGGTQLVYSKPFRIVQDVTITPTQATLDRVRAGGATIAVKGTLRYQACDDAICYVPVDVPVAWAIALKPATGVTP